MHTKAIRSRIVSNVVSNIKISFILFPCYSLPQSTFLAAFFSLSFRFFPLHVSWHFRRLADATHSVLAQGSRYTHRNRVESTDQHNFLNFLCAYFFSVLVSLSNDWVDAMNAFEFMTFRVHITNVSAKFNMTKSFTLSREMAQQVHFKSNSPLQRRRDEIIASGGAHISLAVTR